LEKLKLNSTVVPGGYVMLILWRREICKSRANGVWDKGMDVRIEGLSLQEEEKSAIEKDLT